MRIDTTVKKQEGESPSTLLKEGEIICVPQTWVQKVKNKGLHLFIGTPSRNEQCYIGYASSLAKLTGACMAAGVEVTIHQVRNSCFVAMSRNMLLKEFLNTTATHILMIDDDMSWHPYWSPLAMMAEEKAFIAGAGPVKGDKRFAADLIEWEGDLAIVREVGAAFIMLARDMVEQMFEAYKGLGHPVLDGAPRLFEDQYTNSQWISEDYVFCERWRQLGGEVYVYPDIYFEHLGLYAIEGNYKDYLNAKTRHKMVTKVKENVCC